MRWLITAGGSGLWGLLLLSGIRGYPEDIVVLAVAFAAWGISAYSFLQWFNPPRPEVIGVAGKDRSSVCKTDPPDAGDRITFRSHGWMAASMAVATSAMASWLWNRGDPTGVAWVLVAAAQTAQALHEWLVPVVTFGARRLHVRRGALGGGGTISYGEVRRIEKRGHELRVHRNTHRAPPVHIPLAELRAEDRDRLRHELMRRCRLQPPPANKGR